MINAFSVLFPFSNGISWSARANCSSYFVTILHRKRTIGKYRKIEIEIEIEKTIEHAKNYFTM